MFHTLRETITPVRKNPSFAQKNAKAIESKQFFY